jgi:hypothetical protein
MGFWDIAGRVGLGIGTGGLSEMPGGIGSGIRGAAGDALDWAKGGFGLDRSKAAEGLYGGVDPNGDMARTAGQAADFGQRGMAGYAGAGRDLARQQHRMRGLSDQFGNVAAGYGRIASGQDSISAEQLRQGLQQNQAAQTSAAAGAAPQNQVMAARNAAIQMGRQGMGLAGQQALAGLQERRDALGGQLGAMGGQAGLESGIQGGVLTGRGQDAQVGLGGAQTALQGYGGIEQARTDRYGRLLGVPTGMESILGAAQGAGQMAAMASDRRLKRKVKGADREGADLLKALKAVRYEYKDPGEHGEGEFVGIMAQDLEKSKAGKRAVIDTRRGKMVHGARLATALAATLPGLDKRLKKLEKR